MKKTLAILSLLAAASGMASNPTQAPQFPERLPHPSQDEKLLGLRLWLIETMPVDRDIIAETMEDHIRYQLALEANGIMFAAGPILAEGATKPDGNGIVVIRAKDEATAREIADKDPMHASGGRRYRLRQWIVNEGSLSVRIPFSQYNEPVIE